MIRIYSNGDHMYNFFMGYLSSLVLALAFVVSPNLLAQTVRSELSRYTLLRDRTIIERDLKREPYAQFLDVDIYASSGLRSLVSDVENGSEGGNSQGTANVLEIFNQAINSERYVDIDVALSIPLPYLKIKKFRLLPNIFVQQNLGASLSFSNQQSTTNPLAQVYLKTDRKIGLNTRLKWTKSEEWRLALYRLSRSDTLLVQDAASTAQNEKLFEFQTLDNTRDTIDLDLAYIKNDEKYSFLVEFKELTLTSSSSGRQNTEHGDGALFHTQFTLNRKGQGLFDLFPFIGLHQRKRYSIADGLYIGSRMHVKTEVPMEVIGKLSNQFFTLAPQIKFKWFEFNYSLKLAYRNPQDDIWVPTIHSVSFRFPFP